MVALPYSTVATTNASMVAWAIWTLLLLTAFVHAHANTGDRFSGDVDDDDVMIDKLKDVWLSNQHAIRQLVPSPSRGRHQDVNDKIEFAVTPQDERYYHPPTSRHDPSPSGSELLHRLTSDLSLPPHLEYPGDLLQYPDEDAQYPTEYAAQFRPRYRPQEQRRPSYLSQQDLQFPRALYPGGLQNPRLLAEEEDEPEEGVEEEVEDAREFFRKELAGDADYNGDSQLMMKKEEANYKQETEQSKEVDDTRPDAAAEILPASKLATSQPEAVNYMHLRRASAANHEPGYSLHRAQGDGDQLSDVYFTAVLAGSTAMAVCAVVGAGICWYRLNKSHRAAQDAEYPAYGVTGPNKDLSPSGDRKLAQSAHMYHYQHQKQQMIALEKSSGGERHGSTSDVDSEEDGEENEYTVYECPGLAPTGEMEVKNPLFHDDPTPATPSIRKETEQDHEEDKSNK
ncbi:hypothetical protein O3P69_018300 [Scylla paramamosain]|uniref:Neural proliferation differentiation and control protein 1 n=1 Tax=Scylla paramamosain TaxID=85552 RepID=A0AAW0TK13_SCYPA